MNGQRGMHHGALLSHKKDEITLPAANVDAAKDHHTKKEGERQTPCDITYMESKICINEPIYKTERHRDREQSCGCQVGGPVEGKGWESAISRCKLLSVGWINNTLLYSMGNYIQYPVINQNGKGY